MREIERKTNIYRATEFWKTEKQTNLWNAKNGANSQFISNFFNSLRESHKHVSIKQLYTNVPFDNATIFKCLTENASTGDLHALYIGTRLNDIHVPQNK